MADTKPGIPQGGPPPTRVQVRSWRSQRGNRAIEGFEELMNLCEDGGPDVKLSLPMAKGTGSVWTGDTKVHLAVFAVDRGYVFSESAESIRGLDSLAIDAVAKLRALGLVA